MLTTNDKGAIAETAVIHAAVKAGILVLLPCTDERYDVVFDLGARFVRVQCKWAVRRGDVIVIPCFSRRRAATGMITRFYTRDEVDAVAAYCDAVDRCFFVPIERLDNRRAISLRLAPTRNNQAMGVNWADDYDFERVDWAALRGP